VAGIVSSILTLPLAPVRFLAAVATVLQREAEQELYGPAAVRRQLEELDEEHATGAISDDEHERMQRAVTDRLIHRRP
jgi:hypothetical protein